MEEKELSLRKRLVERPKSARIMSLLACLLVERARAEHKATITDGDDDDSSSSVRLQQQQDEAQRLAHQAIEMAPHKPFGHVALSHIDPVFDERMQSLRRAVAACNNDKTNVYYLTAKIGLLVRLLVEPRQEAARKAVHLAKASIEHATRTDLDPNETLTYQQLELELQQVWNNQTTGESSSSSSCNRSSSSSSHNHWLLSPSQLECVARHDYNLGLFFRKRNPRSRHGPRAMHHFQRAYDTFAVDHSNRAMAQFWLATLMQESFSTTTTTSAVSVMTRCPVDYVVGLYASFAERFDDLLVHTLEYRTPTILRQLLQDVVTTPPNTADTGSICSSKNTWKVHRAVDLGCGTGLSGLAFRDCVAGELVGVDLSPEMIVQAQNRGCYDHFIVGDVVTAVTHTNDTIIKDVGLVIACDVFVYLGGLSNVFAHVYESLIPNGMFAFSTELLVADENNDKSNNPPPSFELHSCARFAHSKRYIEALSKDMGYTILKTKQAPIRKNEGKDVEGLLVVLQKKVQSC